MAKHTSIDCFEKRGQKGFLFTVGDERTHRDAEGELLTRLFGYESSPTRSAAELLASVQERYHVFHIHINSASYRNNQQLFGDWKELLGKRFLVLEDHRELGKLIAEVVAVVSQTEAQASLPKSSPGWPFGMEDAELV